MKALRNLITTATTGLLLTALALSFNACTEDAPLSSEQQTINPQKELKILTFGNPNSSLAKKVAVTEKVSKRRGGRLSLKHKYLTEDGGKVVVKMSLDVLPGALSKDKELKMEIDDAQFLGNFDVVFSEHGTVFNTPAILNIEVKIWNVDPESLDLDNLDIYYDNQEAGQWELMPRDEIDIEIRGNNILIRVINAKLPHFSRYALGGE